jgi:hypothetical protein
MVMVMMIPSFLYGPYSKVKGVCRRKAKELRRGASFADLPADQWLDTASMSGPIVVDGPSRSFAHNREQFCCFALTVAICDEWADLPWVEERDTILVVYHEAALLEPWLFLGLLGQHSGSFLDQRPDWLEPFVRAAVKFWPLLVAEGARYTQSVDPEELWSLHTNIKFALARLGVSVEKLRAPLPPGGLITLAREVLPDLKKE